MTKLITAFAFDNFGFLDIVGPVDVFTIANQRAGKTLYKVNAVSIGRRNRIAAESGLRLSIDSDLAAVKKTHTLLIPGGDGFRKVVESVHNVEQIKRVALNANRVVSVCTGAFILAATGLLNNRRATTHWAYAQELANKYPKINVVPDELFVSTGKYTTSAGIAAGIDLALALVSQDHGQALALETSKRMVLYLNRAGGQSQFSERFESVTQCGDKFDQLLADVTSSPTGNLSNASLADMLSLSERHFARLFNERTGTTPARWVERVRVDHARSQLEKGLEQMGTVAKASGFASVDTMRQAFKRVMGVSPSQYRQNHGQSLEGEP